RHHVHRRWTGYRGYLRTRLIASARQPIKPAGAIRRVFYVIGGAGEGGVGLSRIPCGCLHHFEITCTAMGHCALRRSCGSMISLTFQPWHDNC
ncbi:MAG: hypothetical protein WBO95_07405, partial [Candidatus Dechloromonas phosphoritropha]